MWTVLRMNEMETQNRNVERELSRAEGEITAQHEQEFCISLTRRRVERKKLEKWSSKVIFFT